MRVSLLFLFVTIFSLTGCVSGASNETVPPENGEIIRDQNLVSQLNASSSSVVINDIEYSMESYAWRDFMPSVNPPVRLNSKNTLIRRDGESLEGDLEIVQPYIIKDNQIWRPDEFEVRLIQSSPNRLDIISREGPTWEIGSTVNAGLKIKYQQTGNTYWFSVSGVEIVKTQ